MVFLIIHYFVRFRCEVDCKKYPTACIDENLFVSMIDTLVKDGWLEAGYRVYFFNALFF